MSLLLGIDLGTSYFKVGLFDPAGRLKGLGRVAVARDAPAPGRCELPVGRFWTLLRQGLEAALTQASASAQEIAGVSYSSQANSFVLLDRDEAALTPLILWTDQRAEPIADDLAKFSRREDFVGTVGFAGWSGGFAVAKWRWLQQHAPDLWARKDSVMTIADYFTFALTGERVGDASTAAFLGLYDLGRREWWPDALAACGIRAEYLSRPLAPGTRVGQTVSRATGLLGLPKDVPFAVGGLDHHVAALGAGLGRLGDIGISTGTVLAAIALVSKPAPREGCFHGPHFDRERFYRLAFDPDGAMQIEDYQRRYAADRTVEELLGLAESAPSLSARPVDLGAMEPGTATRHLLEKIAAAHRDLIEQVAAGARISGVVASGGGARSPLWLQIKADTFGVPVRTAGCPEGACLGAAMLAAVAAGCHRDADQAMDAMLQRGPIYVPGAAAARR